MNVKMLSLAVSLSSCIMMVSTPISFEYRYEIIMNSYHPFEQSKVYEYKEKLIDVYEELCLEKEEREHQDIIINNIDLFKFDEYCIPFYDKGAIKIIIGNGNGPTYKGTLRRNECDGNSIREKLYIYELFN